jgi:site-specific DNA-methyltransferase (adenine-specific)
MKNRNLDIDNNWITPKQIYDPLNEEFKFDFDPCPYFVGEITTEKNGILIPWGKSNFVNPPYEEKLKEAFVKRAIEESKKGSVCVLLIPVSTSTKLFHKHIKPNASEIRFLEKRIKFQKRTPDGILYTPKSGGQHDSMVVVFGNNNAKNQAIENQANLFD